MLTPAMKLQGYDLDNGWTVEELVPKDPYHTGGNFSIGYRVRKADGMRGFLKALDFLKTIRHGIDDPVTQTRIFVENFEFERNLVKDCNGFGLNRIVRLLDDGTATIDGIQVPYLIFEEASTDLRSFQIASRDIDVSLALRVLHHVAVGIQQLHRHDIAHQDIKPSNVFFFKEGPNKLGDFGRCATPDCQLEHMEYTIAGDPHHAPIEGLYNYSHPDWRTRRYGCDGYQLASLLVFLLTGTSLTSLIYQALADPHRYNNWGDG